MTVINNVRTDGKLMEILKTNVNKPDVLNAAMGQGYFSQQAHTFALYGNDLLWEYVSQIKFPKIETEKDVNDACAWYKTNIQIFCRCMLFFFACVFVMQHFGCQRKKKTTTKINN